MQGELTLDPAWVRRFKTGLEALPGATDEGLGLAVSGGADSLALLLLAHAACPDTVRAATVDHGLRPEAAAEASHVAALCARLGLPHATLRGDGPSGGNLQNQARLLRYRLLDDWAKAQGLSRVATAHHRDDVAETFLMRAARGAGVRSLAAISPARTLDFSTVQLVRPLLGWTRAELAAIVEAAGIAPVVDPSNADPRFDRVRVRALLATMPDLPPAGLARSATNLRDVEEALEWWVSRELLARLEEDGTGGAWLRAADLPFELKRRFVLRAIEGVRQASGIFDAWRATAVPDLVRTLEAGAGGMVADVQARVVGECWHFRPAPPRRAPADLCGNGDAGTPSP